MQLIFMNNYQDFKSSMYKASIMKYSQSGRIRGKMYRISKVLNHHTVISIEGESNKECLIMGKGIGFSLQETKKGDGENHLPYIHGNGSSIIK